MSRSLALLSALLLAGAGHAAPFADPTQPPVFRESEAVPLLAGPRVESILIAPDRRLAVIDGQQVTVGGRVGGNAVVRITETEVVVRGADGEQTLRLYPELVRKPAGAAKRGTSK